MKDVTIALERGLCKVCYKLHVTSQQLNDAMAELTNGGTVILCGPCVIHVGETVAWHERTQP